MLQQMAAQRAQQAVQESEQKLAFLKKWDRDLENWTEPFVKQVGQLQSFLANDLARAVVYLTQIIQTLEAYADGLTPDAPAAVPPTNETKTTS